MSRTDVRSAPRTLHARRSLTSTGQEDTRARAAMPDEPALRKFVDQFAGPRTRLLVTDRRTGSENVVRLTVAGGEIAESRLTGMGLDPS